MNRKGIVVLTFRSFTLLVFWITVCKTQENHTPKPSSCGNIYNITCPFRLKGDHQNCNGTTRELICQENRTVLNVYSNKYYVNWIDYNNYSLHVVDPGVIKGDCSSFPLYSLSSDVMEGNFVDDENIPIFFISCSAPVNSSKYIDTSSCIKNRSISSISSSPYSLQAHTYVAFGDMYVSDLKDSCRLDLVTWISSSRSPVNRSFPSIHEGLAYGFDLFLEVEFCRSCRTRNECCSSCRPGCHSSTLTWKEFLKWLWKRTKEYLPVILIYLCVLIALLAVPKFFIGILCLSTLLVYKWRRRHISMYEIIEDFLQSDNNLKPIRYTYREIKKMTNGFKDKLGEGGFGTVFKGKLRSGLLVAVKMMNSFDSSGQEFISEVSTIGRIHHVSVVRLIGYCAEGSKRVLVYEFMLNGSLEKYIFPDQQNETAAIMSYEKMFQISLGVARAIDYLHRGCDMQILHFDIKPHNILLNENFTPKVSDFGLAKLFPTKDITVPLTAARGTIGYMAPELFYRNIGGVSYKADVYSFGMLLLEMAGRRKNLNPIVEQLSQIYFPSWVYDQLNQGHDTECVENTECEKKMVKKMMIVALWCIQMKPVDRPCMNEVVEMLEGDLNVLQMPQKPFLSPQEMSSS